MLHVIYRSFGGENRKTRPAYYSKQLALVSFLRALAKVNEAHEIIYVNDGSIPADRFEIMSHTGEIVARENRGLSGSLRDALEIAVNRNWDAGDLVWFAEDDYLYAPDAFAGLTEALCRLSDADYFALYATIGRRPPYDAPPFSDEQLGCNIEAARWRGSEPVMVQGHPWRIALSTTSTFGGRVAAVREDRFLMELAIRSGGAFDHTFCVISQNLRPFSWGTIARQMRAARSFQAARSVALRATLNLWRLARRGMGRRGRIWVAPDPALATHLDTAYMASGTDWAAVAHECRLSTIDT